MSEILDLKRVVDGLVVALDRYDPNQPRDPGGEGGGQWIASGSGATVESDVKSAKKTIDEWEKSVDSNAADALGDSVKKATDPYRKLFKMYVDRLRGGTEKLISAVKANDMAALRRALKKVNLDLNEFRGIRDSLNLTTFAEWQEHEATFRTLLNIVGRAT